MQKRKIPALSQNNTKYHLKQVIAIVRHGSRAPNHLEHCWDGYLDPDSDTSTWDCNLNGFIATGFEKASNFAFERIYDENADPLEKERMNGSCRYGQLLDEAFDQEYTNGELLRNAYIATDYDSMRLFRNSSENEYFLEPWTYFRADDIPRCRKSGEILLQGLFKDVTDAKITLHTADHKGSLLTTSERHCPRLEYLRKEAYSSSEYKIGLKSIKLKKVYKMYTRELGGAAHDVMDCLMTTMCSDRTLPHVLDDFDGNEYDGHGYFSRLVNYETWKNQFLFDYDNAKYSKTMTTPLWNDMLQRMNQTIDDTNSFISHGRNRLILYSAHDTTISTILATLGKDLATFLSWPPYASMLIFEVYSFLEDNSKHDLSKLSFRIVYNGEVLTHIVQGCSASEELCSLKILFDKVKEFAMKDQECSTEEYTS